MPVHDMRAKPDGRYWSMQAATDGYVTSESEDLTPALRSALRLVEQTVEQMNHALQLAAEAGATIEVRRRNRVHSGDGSWADQMAPLVLPKPRV